MINSMLQRESDRAYGYAINDALQAQAMKATA
jgi:hypothetical protein